jgi:DNA-binding MarR family transcriptional regulator
MRIDRRSSPNALEFMQVLWALNHGLEATSKRMNARLGVTGLQRLVVRLVGKTPGVSAGGLATALHVHPSTLTAVLKRLEQRRAIQRTRDGRSVRFNLLAEGERINSVRLGTVESAMERALRRLDIGDVVTAAHVLGAVTRELDELLSLRKVGGSKANAS